MNDGSLGYLYQEYQDRLGAAGTIGLGGRDSPQCIHADLDAAVRYLDSDLTFVHSGEVYNHFLSLYLKLYLCV